MASAIVRMLWASLVGACAATAAAAVHKPLDIGNEAAPTFAVYTVQDGLTDEIWNALGRDDQGFVWAGSASTLARFDGGRWRLWPAAGASSLVEDLTLAGGSLWAIFQGHGLYRRAAGRWQAQTGVADVPTIAFDTPRADGGQDHWIGLEDGLWRWTDGRWQREQHDDDAPLQGPLGMARTERLFGRPRQWLATRFGLMYREARDGTSWTPWRPFEAPSLQGILSTDAIRSVADGEEELWVTTYGLGIARINAHGVRWWTAANGDLPGESIYGGVATYESDGTRLIWLASRSGLLQIRGDRIRAFDRRHGLPSNAVRRLMVQRVADGTELLWIATEGGIARATLGRSAWQTVSLMGARDNGIFSAMIEPDDAGGERLWIGASEEGLGVLQGGQWRYFRHADGTLPGVGVRQIWRLPGPDGQPWRVLSLMESGLWRVHDDFRFESIPAPWVDKGVATDIATSALARQVDGAIEWWVALVRGGVYRWRDGRWAAFALDGQSPPWNVVRLTEQVDAHGRSWLWGVGAQGIARFDGERWQLLEGLANLPIDSYRGASLIVEQGKPVLWASSQRHGVVRLAVPDPLRPSVLPRDDLPPPPDPYTYSALRDSTGRIFICTNNGVQQLTPLTEGGYSSRIHRRRDGLLHDECNTNAQLIDARDRYWVGTMGGLSMLDPTIASTANAEYAARTRVATLIVDGEVRSVDSRTRWNLPAGTREVRIEFGLLDAYRETDAQFRTRLVGYDQDWSGWTAEPSRSYTRPPAGHYRFEVESRDFSGHAAMADALDIVVAPYWWQRTAVQALSALAAIAMVVVAVRAYLRGLRRRQLHLEALVAARTVDLHEANRQLTELSYRDPLTGIANRRRLLEAMQAAMIRSVEQGRPLGVIVIDVDHFKAYNDRFGHLSGDTALRAVAQALSSATREHDLVARHGGEEFACLMVDAAPDVALAVAERMRALVEALPPRLLGNDVQTLTLSAGVICRVPRVDERAEDLLAAADAALYEAKHKGRNRVCAAQ